MLYTTESPALSLLEVLVHINPKRIPEYHLVTLDVPDSIRFYGADELPTNLPTVPKNQLFAAPAESTTKILKVNEIYLLS